MTIIDKIIKGDIAPENTNVLWLNTEDNIIYVFNNGWVPTSTGGVTSVYTGTEAERLAIEDPFNGLEFHQVDEDGKVTRYLYEEDAWRVVVELTPEDAEYYHELATEDHQNAVADHQNAIDDHAQYLVDHESIAHKANVDGYYGQMTVGAAENLVGDSEETYTFTTHMTGGETDFGSGAGQLTKVQGNGLAWNQLVKIPTSDISKVENGVTIIDNRDGSYTISTDENGATAATRLIFAEFSNKTSVYLCYFYDKDCPSGVKIGNYGTGGWTNGGNIINGHFSKSEINIASGTIITTPITISPICFDLSLIFGLGNEPTTVADAEARLAALVAQKPYYQYNAGELFGTKVLHLISYGQNLLNPANGQARLAPYAYESVVNKYGIAAKAGVTLGAITFTPDATGVAETITPDSNGQFTISGAGTLSVAVSAGSLADVYVWAVYDGAKDGINNYVPFQQDALEIKASEIYGKLNGAGDMVKVFSDDVMRGAGSAHDIIDLQSMTADVNVGSVDLGTLDWYLGNIFYAPLTTSSLDTNSRCICKRYAPENWPASNMSADLHDKSIALGANHRYVYSKDSSYESASEFRTSLSGIPLWYELATPAHYTDLKLSSDGGETFRDLPSVIVVDNWGVWQQKPSEGLTPATGHDFEGVAATISTILPMDAVEILKSVQDNGIMTSDQRAQLTNILTALQTAGIIGSFTIAETPTDKVFPITITAPVEPEP